MFNKYFLPSTSILVVIALLHYLALDRDYYWTISWYDIMMHFLGGVWTTLFVLWCLNMDDSGRLSQFAQPRFIITFVFFVGVFWELYELAFGITFISDANYAFDTTLDMVMDIAGAVTTTFYVREAERNVNIQDDFPEE